MSGWYRKPMVIPERQTHPVHGHLDDIISVLSGINKAVYVCVYVCMRVYVFMYVCLCVCAFCLNRTQTRANPASPQLYKTLKGEARQAVNSFSVSGELTWENRLAVNH